MEFLPRLARPAPMLLDGATGTELERRGVNTGLPLWSANALLSDDGARTLRHIHADYLAAGAEILTTNTFRTHRRALAPSGNAGRAFELTRKAVDIARSAGSGTAAQRPYYVAGSISTLEDCYRLDLVPRDDEIRAEQSERVHHLVKCDVDLILIETMNTIREAEIAARLAVITGTPVIVSFVCDPGGRILSGESISAAAALLAPLGICALGVNCTPVSAIARPLAELRSACGPDFPLVAYGNIGHADDSTGWVNTDSITPAEYAAAADSWPVRILGGCCGTTPAHIAELKEKLSQ